MAITDIFCFLKRKKKEEKTITEEQCPDEVNTIMDDLPLADIYESAGGIQSCCPVCKYGIGDQSSFVDGFQKVEIHRCSVCGTVYRNLTM